MITELKSGTIPVRKCQYPLPTEAWAGILPYINRLKQAGILVECQSAWNMLILPVKKEGGQDYRPVQDLRLVNQPTVPNPYTLLSLLLLRTKVYTRLDLKDAFFCVHLAPASQPIFAFEWEDPVGGTKQQLIWTPPQGFKNSPAILEKALASDLNSFHPEEYRCWLLQYGDDLLLAAETKEKFWKGTKTLL